MPKTKTEDSFFQWKDGDPPKIVERYCDCFGGEFNTSFIKSEYPYSGLPSKLFKPINTENKHQRTNLFADGFEYFPNKGHGLWVLRLNHEMNNITADILVAAAYFNELVDTDRYIGQPGGGIEAYEIWIPLLDGGAGVEVHLYEHETTNQVTIGQRTCIRGLEAYSQIVTKLGFNPPRISRK